MQDATVYTISPYKPAFAQQEVYGFGDIAVYAFFFFEGGYVAKYYLVPQRGPQAEEYRFRFFVCGQRFGKFGMWCNGSVRRVVGYGQLYGFTYVPEASF